MFAEPSFRRQRRQPQQPSAPRSALGCPPATLAHPSPFLPPFAGDHFASLRRGMAWIIRPSGKARPVPASQCQAAIFGAPSAASDERGARGTGLPGSRQEAQNAIRQEGMTASPSRPSPLPAPAHGPGGSHLQVASFAVTSRSSSARFRPRAARSHLPRISASAAARRALIPADPRCGRAGANFGDDLKRRAVLTRSG